MDDVLKPQPRVNALTRPFWDGANDRRLMIQRCADPACGKAVFYPRVCCPHCQGPALDWVEATGRGTVVSHTTVRRTHHDGFNAEAPYVFAAVALDEGPLLYAQLPGAPLEGSLTGRAVSVDFAAHGPGRLMPVFRLA
jgi:uncharacterized OB-fold protein